MEERDVIEQTSKITNKYIDMKSLPEEFRLGVSLMARDLYKDLTEATLVRTKEYAEHLKIKSELVRLTFELNEALEYWNNKIAKHDAVHAISETEGKD